jgi:hypothetical protein
VISVFFDAVFAFMFRYSTKITLAFAVSTSVKADLLKHQAL